MLKSKWMSLLDNLKVQMNLDHAWSMVEKSDPMNKILEKENELKRKTTPHEDMEIP